MDPVVRFSHLLLVLALVCLRSDHQLLPFSPFLALSILIFLSTSSLLLYGHRRSDSSVVEQARRIQDGQILAPHACHRQALGFSHGSSLDDGQEYGHDSSSPSSSSSSSSSSISDDESLIEIELDVPDRFGGQDEHSRRPELGSFRKLRAIMEPPSEMRDVEEEEEEEEEGFIEIDVTAGSIKC